MNEPRLISLTALVSSFLWITVIAAISGSWTLVATGHPFAAVALGFTACIPCAAAITLTIRGYVLRMCDMIRSLYGIQTAMPTIESAPDLGNVRRL